ncbi:MAG: hypothetical protein ABI051_15615 [Vicinamibacterales bacterium]
MVPCRLAMVALLALAAADSSRADAQVRRLEAPPVVELGVSGVTSGPMSFGNASADLTKADGSPFTLFKTANSVGPERGVAAHVAVALTRRLSAEVLGGWTRANLRSRISDDFEGAAPLTIVQPLSRISVEAAGLWAFHRRPAGSLFIRGGGGWIRELAGASVLAQNGTVANLGAGVKYWWRHRAGGGLSHIGFRLEGHASMHWKGVSLGSDTVHVAPVISGGLILGS